MTESYYTASLRPTHGSVWTLIFRHPKWVDPSTGKVGLRVNMSLKTNDETQAAVLRDQMNALLASPQLWDLGAREQALGHFDPRELKSSSTSWRVVRSTFSRCATV